MSIRVFIADDHAVFRSGLRALLDLEKEIQVVGEAGTGKEAMDQLEFVHADVVLLDVNMPGMSGREVVSKLHASQPKLSILMLTMHEDPYYVQEFFDCGATGYVLKKSTGTDVVRAIKAVYSGDNYLDPALVCSIMTSRVNGGKCSNGNGNGNGSRLDRLSEREQEVCKLLALGHSHTRIGEALNISPRTVESHRANIMSKLDFNGRAELVQFALDEGMLKPI